MSGTSHGKFQTRIYLLGMIETVRNACSQIYALFDNSFSWHGVALHMDQNPMGCPRGAVAKGLPKIPQCKRATLGTRLDESNIQRRDNPFDHTDFNFREVTHSHVPNSHMPDVPTPHCEHADAQLTGTRSAGCCNYFHCNITLISYNHICMIQYSYNYIIYFF